MNNNNKTISTEQVAENPDKVLDTSGIESALSKDNTTLSRNSKQTETQTNTQSTNQDDPSGSVVSPNGIPVSSSLGTARTAFIKSGGRNHTVQLDEDLSTTTYR